MGTAVSTELTIYLDAEIDILGSLMRDPGYCAADIFYRVSPADFVHGEYRLVFETAKAMYSDDIAINRISLSSRLGKDYHDMLNALEARVPSATAYKPAIYTLKREARRIRAHEMAGEIANRLLLGDDPDAVLSCAAELVGVLGDVEQEEDESLGALLLEVMQDMESEKTFLDWGFDKFNHMIPCEPREGTNIILAARPSVGKTALALQLAAHLSKRHRVIFYSLETDRKKIGQRLLTSDSFVDYGKLRRAKLQEAEWGQITKSTNRLSKRSLVVKNASGWTADQIFAHAVRNQAEIVFVDYLQLVSHSNSKINADEYARVTATSRAMQQLSRRGKTVISLCQLSRYGSEYSPKLSDLRSSGQIEQDGDVIAFLCRQDPKDSGLTEAQCEDCERDLLRVFDISKNRDGELGSIPMWFQGKYQHFMQEWDHVYTAPIIDMPPQSVEYMDKCPQIIAGEKPKSVKETRGRPMKETRNE